MEPHWPQQVLVKPPHAAPPRRWRTAGSRYVCEPRSADVRRQISRSS